MAALSSEKTLAELSSEFGVHPTMISTWKQELAKRASELFARGNKAHGGRRCAKGDRRSAPQDRPVAGRTGFSCRAARHLPSAERRAMIAPNAGLSVNRQCMLLGIARSSFYYQPRPTSAEEFDLLNRLDRIFTEHPVYGSRRLQVALLREGISVGRRRIRRLCANWDCARSGRSATPASRIRSTRSVIAHPAPAQVSPGRLVDSTNRTVPRTEARFAFAVLTTERKAA